MSGAEGIDTKRPYDEVELAVHPGTLLEWAKLIELAVKTHCGDQVTFKGRIESNGRFHIDYDPSDGSLDCVIGVIRGHLEFMHPATQSIYEQFIEAFKVR